MATITQEQKINQVSMEKLEPLYRVDKNVKHVHRGKQFVGFSKSWKKEVPYDPAIPPQGIYPQNLKAGSQTDTCMDMFTAALFTKAKRWKQPECP